MVKWLNLNGALLPANEAMITHTNRAFRYGDGLFESIRVAFGKPQFLDAHIQRLLAGMRLLKMDVPAGFTTQRIHDELQQLCAKSMIAGDARARISVYRNEGGLYAPESNKVSYLIEAEPMDVTGYTLNSKGYTVDVFTDIKKPLNILSPYKTSNAILYVMAGVHRNERHLDDCVIINEKGNICEAISSNIFVVKNGALYTPSLDEGCIAGVMRQQVLQVARENRIAVYEISLLMNVLLNADELFLTNAAHGIRWVSAYKSKRYFNNTAAMITGKLNEVAAKGQRLSV